LLILPGILNADHPGGSPSSEVLVLCYHSIQPRARANDSYTITQNQFAEQMDYLVTHGYRPVSLEDVIAARRGEKVLPPKSVMLTFDDAYRSYGEFVVPLLSHYGFPSMLAVVGSWIESGPPPGLPEPLLAWSQLAELSKNPLVAIVSHSYDLHKGIIYTPQGDEGAVVSVPGYSDQIRRHENTDAYRRKLQLDFQQQQALFQKRLNLKPRAMVWPYGHYNAIGLETAEAFGIPVTFTLDEKDLIRTRPRDDRSLYRLLVINKSISRFIYDIHQKSNKREPIRAAQVDLDLIYSSKSKAKTEQNLGQLIDRLVQIKVNTVFLQAFADPDGSGNIRQVYFNNRWLPVRSDLFAHAVHRMKIRGIKVFAWLPVLSYVFPDDEFNHMHQVRQNDSQTRNTSEYQRLSPFSREVQTRVAELFTDMARGSQISGVLFQDDAYLGEDEDFYPGALEAFHRHVGRTIHNKELLPGAPMAGTWKQFKTRRLIAFTQDLSAAVRRYRPDALFARNVYAPLLVQPEAEGWFAQNYEDFLGAYDLVVVMAYPQMERVAKPLDWLQALAGSAGQAPMGIQKTVFKLQTYDWRSNQWVPESALIKQMRTVLAAGVRHLAYYPDNVWEGRPEINTIKLEMSTLADIEAQ
jgi:biofilm PGA synthesis lipoprotein PgaB